MSRSIAGLILTSLAAFFAATAVISGGRLARDVTSLPVNINATVSLTAARASYLSPVKLTEITGADITVTDTITGVTPGSDYGSIAIWNVAESTRDTTHRLQLEPETRTVVFDRRTAEMVNCCDSNINGNGLTRQSGLSGYAFPVPAGKQAYTVFDTVLGAAQPLKYAGSGTVNGVAAYLYTETVTAAKAGISPLVPAKTARYSVQRVYWVDPQTGLLLKMSEAEDLYVARTAGSGAGTAARAGATHLFDANLHMTPASVALLVSIDTSARDKISLVAELRAACLCVAGVLAVIAGWLLLPLSLLRRLRLARRPPVPAVALPGDDVLPPDNQLAPDDQLQLGDQFALTGPRLPDDQSGSGDQLPDDEPPSGDT